jgi:dTDP-4-amino-4,6-dideoxygalactose transaminase
VGSWGDATAFSFYATKSLSTGEGGMVVTGDPDLAARMRIMRLHGISRDAFDRYRAPGAGWQYEIVAPGFKYNLTDLAAALGLQQLARLDRMAAARESIARLYDEGLGASADLILPPGPETGERHSWHLYSIRVRGGRARRDRVIELLAEAGVGTSVHFIPLHRMPYWRERYELTESEFPVAEEIFAGQISLPIYPSLGPDQVERVIDAVLGAVAETG